MKNKINALQFGSMLIIILMASFIGVGIYTCIYFASRDSYMSVLMAGIVGSLLLFLLFYISNYDQDKTIGELNVSLFGKVIGSIINGLLIIGVIFMGVSAMYNLNSFIVSQFLSETPLLIIGIIFALLTIYINMKGIETISRVTLIFFVINVILFGTAIIGLVPEVDIKNFKPILEFGMSPVFKGAFYILTLNIAPIFLLLCVPKGNIVNKEKYKKYLSMFYILGIVFMTLIIIMTIGTLDIDLARIYQYPEYIVLKRISLFNFLDRLENILNIQWILGLFVIISVVVYYTSETIKKDNKLLKVIITFIILLLSTYVFESNTAFNKFTIDIYPMARLGIIVIHIIIGIMIFIKKKKKNISQ